MWILARRLTKIRIPSAFVFHLSAVLSSSSTAIFEYRENIGPELSLKVVSAWNADLGLALVGDHLPHGRNQ